jgi:hypothetical protein
VDLSTGLLNFWAASTIRHQGMLVSVVTALAHAATNRHASRAATAA